MGLSAPASCPLPPLGAQRGRGRSLEGPSGKPNPHSLDFLFIYSWQVNLPFLRKDSVDFSEKRGLWLMYMNKRIWRIRTCLSRVSLEHPSVGI